VVRAFPPAWDARLVSRLGQGVVEVSLPPGTVVGKYVVQRKLAEGGMAEIFLATAQGAEGFEKPVVIKRIRSGLANDSSFVEMFIAEARLASRLSHPNLVHIFDFDRHEDTYYLAMEYIRGRSLLEAHKRASEVSTPIPPVLVAQLGVEIARGLGYAHKLTDHGKPLNLVHRDVTPHNVLLSYEGAVKLTDFGIAKAGGRATTAGMLKGKFAYMAPEQARGDPVDARTDLFSLGITLWELLTGGRLFDGDTDLAVLRAVQERPVLPPADLNPEVDDELSGIIVKTLERLPSNRYQTAAELERALLQYVLHHSQGPEDTDVGAFVRDLFPVESERAETPVTARPGSAVGRPSRDVSTGAVPRAEAVSAHAPLAHRAMPPDMLGSEPQSDKTLLYDTSQGARSDRDGSHRTQPTQDDALFEDGSTLRRPAPVGIRKLALGLSDRLKEIEVPVRDWVAKLIGTKPSRPVLVVGGVALLSTLVSVVLAVLLSRPADKPHAAPSEFKPLTLDVGKAEPAAASQPSGEPPLARPLLPLTTAPAESVAARDEGFLEVTLTPSGTISIDGKEAAPVEGTRRFKLKAGHHEVTASDSKVIVGWSVYVRPGATVKKQYAFRRRKYRSVHRAAARRFPESRESRRPVFVRASGLSANR
jgi:eukaryotic-like serine/threonine-protein kinase